MIKPGDIIEWMYKKTGKLVVEDETSWSTLTESWCLIGSNLIHTCIACDGETITWLNSNGLFHACVDDVSPDEYRRGLAQVVPRVKK
jgi:hypothetical protein